MQTQDIVFEAINQYGPLGAILVACFSYILRQERTHATERKEWRKQADQQQAQLLGVVNRVNQAIQELTLTLQKTVNFR